MSTHPKGWRVYAGTKKARARTEFDLAWRAISRLFAVRSAAEQFATLAQRQMPEARIEVRPVDCADGR